MEECYRLRLTGRKMCSDVKHMLQMGIHEHEWQFHLISLSPFQLSSASAFASVYASAQDFNLSRCSAMFVWASQIQILKEELLFEAPGPGSDGEVCKRGREGSALMCRNRYH